MADMRVAVVAPDGEIWSGDASLVIAKTTEGDIGIMPGHEPVLAVLVDSVVEVRPVDGEPVFAAVHGGFLSVAQGEVSVLAEEATIGSEISVSEAEAALREAGDDEEAARRARSRVAAASGRLH